MGAVSSSLRRPSRLAVWLALGLVYVFWGSTYLGIRITIETLPPLLTAATRFLLAAATLGLIAAARGELRRARPTPRQLASSAAVGVMLFGFGNGMVVLSERHIASGIASLVVAISPLLVALISFVAFRQPLGRIQAAGMLLGLAGLVMLSRPAGAAAVNALGLALALGSAIAWSSGSVFASRADLPRTPLLAASLQMLFGGLALVVLGSLLGEPRHLDLARASARSLAALLYLVVFGSLVAFTAYSFLVRAAPLSLVFTYVYVNPVIAVGLGALVVGERVSGVELLGGAVILAGVAIIVTGQAVAGRHGAARAAAEGGPQTGRVGTEARER